MMDNTTHHPVVQLNTTTPPNMTSTQQQQSTMKSPGEPDHFLTIRLLMQGKVSYCSHQNSWFLLSLTSGSWQHHWKTWWQYKGNSRRSKYLHWKNKPTHSSICRVVLVSISVTGQHQNVLLPWLVQSKHYRKHSGWFVKNSKMYDEEYHFSIFKLFIYDYLGSKTNMYNDSSHYITTCCTSQSMRFDYRERWCQNKRDSRSSYYCLHSNRMDILLILIFICRQQVHQYKLHQKCYQHRQNALSRYQANLTRLNHVSGKYARLCSK